MEGISQDLISSNPDLSLTRAHKPGQLEPVGKYLPLTAEPTQMGPSCPCNPIPRRVPDPSTVIFGHPGLTSPRPGRRLRSCPHWSAAGERSVSWQQAPPVSSPFSLSSHLDLGPSWSTLLPKHPPSVHFPPVEEGAAFGAGHHQEEHCGGVFSGEGITLHPKPLLPLPLPPPAARIRLEGLTERCGNRDPCSEDSQRHTANAWLEPVRSHRSPGGAKDPQRPCQHHRGHGQGQQGTAKASQRAPGDLQAAHTHPPPRRWQAP